MKAIPILACIFLITISYSCSDSPEETTKGKTETPQAATSEDETSKINGSYSNASGKLIITNYVADKGFDYRVMFDNPEDCEGVDYEGTATFDSKNHAVSSDDPYERDEFTFRGKKLKFEPNMGMIGMECARVVDVEFRRD